MLLVGGGSRVTPASGCFFLEPLLLPEPTVCTLVPALRGPELAVFISHQERSQCRPAEHAGRETSGYGGMYHVSFLFRSFFILFLKGRRMFTVSWLFSYSQL